ncbi:hypothetical protein V502_05896 [Pseudogymnoascus sp. VKM F-4520 (FW-2644)]|nr:hypothetical protein V502_05896 [Pseudogymnoascus sp. VKM F-4520 (FW-2644)]
MTSETASASGSGPSRRLPRSKIGCLTCRRRRVRCNEQKPRCSHCERLNLECLWRPIAPISANHRQHTPQGGTDQRTWVCSDGGQSTGTPSTFIRNNNNFATVNSDFNDTFSYANFMWDHELQRSMVQDGSWHDFGISSAGGVTEGIMAEASRPVEQSSGLSNRPEINHERIVPNLDPTGADTSLIMAWNDLGGDEDASEEGILKDYFAQTVVPPIIAQVETQSKWSSTRQILLTMSTNSSMVHYAILAFSDLLMKRTQTAHNLSRHRYYKLAKTELLRARKEQLLGKDAASPASFDDMLAVLFFLSYIDLLESRIANAHENLKEAYSIFQQISNVQSRTVTRRLISWIRLLDARAATTGGEGLFLAEENDDVLTQPSPTFTDALEAGSNSSNHEAPG